MQLPVFTGTLYPPGTLMVPNPLLEGQWMASSNAAGTDISKFICVPNPNGQGGHTIPRELLPDNWRSGMGIVLVNGRYEARPYFTEEGTPPYTEFDYGVYVDGTPIARPVIVDPEIRAVVLDLVARLRRLL